MSLDKMKLLRIQRLAIRTMSDIEGMPDSSLDKALAVCLLMFDELELLMAASGLQVVADTITVVKASMVSLFDSMARQLSGYHDRLEVEKCKVMGYRKQAAHPMRDASDAVKREYFSIPEKKWKMPGEDNAIKFGDAEEVEEREKREKKAKKKVMYRLLDRLELGLPIDVYELGDIYSLLDFCILVANNMRKGGQAAIDETRTFINRIEEMKDIKIDSVEKMEQVKGQIHQFVSYNSIHKVSLKPISIEPYLNQFTEAEKDLFSKFDEKQKEMVLKAINRFKKMKDDKQERSTMTPINNAKITQLMSGKEGRFLLKISDLEEKLSVSQSELQESKNSVKSYEKVCDELLIQVTEYSNEISILVAKHGLGDIGKHIIEKNMKRIQDIALNSKVDKLKRQMSQEFQSSMFQAVSDFTQITIDIVNEMPDTENKAGLLKRYKPILKEVARRVLSKDAESKEDLSRMNQEVDRIIKEKIDQNISTISNSNPNSVNINSTGSLKSNRSIEKSKINSRKSSPKMPNKSITEIAYKSHIQRDIASKPKLEVKIDKPSIKDNSQTDNDNSQIDLMMTPKVTMQSAGLARNNAAKFQKMMGQFLKPDRNLNHKMRTTIVSTPDNLEQQPEISILEAPEYDDDSLNNRGISQYLYRGSDGQISASKNEMPPGTSLFMPAQNEDSLRYRKKSSGIGSEGISKSPLLNKRVLNTDEQNSIHRSRPATIIDFKIDKNEVLDPLEEDIMILKALCTSLGGATREYKAIIGNKRVEISTIRPELKPMVKPFKDQHLHTLDNSDRLSTLEPWSALDHKSSHHFSSNPAAQRNRSLEGRNRHHRLDSTGLVRRRPLNLTDQSSTINNDELHNKHRSMSRLNEKATFTNIGNDELSLMHATRYEAMKEAPLATGLIEVYGQTAGGKNMVKYALGSIFEKKVNHRDKNRIIKVVENKESADQVHKEPPGPINIFKQMDANGKVIKTFLADMHEMLQIAYDNGAQKVRPPSKDELERDIETFVKEHNNCGHLCGHLLRFYERIGFLKALQHFKAGQRKMLPKINIGEDPTIKRKIYQQSLGSNTIKLWTVKYIDQPSQNIFI